MQQIRSNLGFQDDSQIEYIETLCSGRSRIHANRAIASSMELPKRIAIVHEWFTSMRGGEKCVEALCEVFPEATLFALLHVKGSVSPTIEHMPIRTSFVQHLPFAAEHYRYYLPLFPSAIERLDVSDFDLVISSNHCVAKGVRAAPHTLHICYCYTPMRYIWGLYDEYFGKDRAGFITRAGMKLFLNYLRRWDVRTAVRPNHFVAISHNVRHRIREIYGRSSDIIYPPVDASVFTLSRRREDYFLIVSALVPYKRVDLAIEAFNRTGDKLLIVGDGPDESKLYKTAQPNIEFVGWASEQQLKAYYAGCQALVFPGEEDFGIVPLEALASGKPVIAYAKGGCLETVKDTPEFKTGILFREQTVDSLVAAIRRFKETEFSAESLRSFALTFDKKEFKRRMKEYIEKRWKEFSEASLQVLA